MNPLEFVYGCIAIISSILIAYFTYSIYKFTKGGSLGWKYFAIGGICLGIWASGFILFDSFFKILELKLLTSSIAIPLIAIFYPLAPIKLIKDFGIKKPKWLSEKNLLFLFSILFFPLLIYNLVLPSELKVPYFWILAEIAEDGVFTMVFTFIFAIVGCYYLWKQTKLKPWKYLGIAAFFVCIGQFFSELATGCCLTNTNLNLPEFSQELCKSLSTTGASTLSLCFPQILPITLLYPIFVITALVITCIFVYKIYKSMK